MYSWVANTEQIFLGLIYTQVTSEKKEGRIERKDWRMKEKPPLCDSLVLLIRHVK